jgi:23S rRNA (adenine1618-N6)-methyltransferase
MISGFSSAVVDKRMEDVGKLMSCFALNKNPAQSLNIALSADLSTDPRTAPGIIKHQSVCSMPTRLPAGTGSLHHRNIHQGRYDFAALCKSCPELRAFMKHNPKGEDTIDFSDSRAVVCLNKALLAYHYQIVNWQIPEGYLCPPIPGRADYIHYAADLLTSSDQPEVPRGKKIHVLDIGVGANCIYPIIGSQSYGWKFVGTDIDPIALNVAKAIVQSNPGLSKLVTLRLQSDPSAVFKGIIKSDEHFDLTLCNPPFHASGAEASEANQRKRTRLSKNTRNFPGQGAGSPLNFGGQDNELWCAGGELGFLMRMVNESVEFSQQVYCFTSLVSKKENVAPLQKNLSRLGATRVEVVTTHQGQKTSRLLAWSFLAAQQRQAWFRQRGF